MTAAAPDLSPTEKALCRLSRRILHGLDLLLRQKADAATRKRIVRLVERLLTEAREAAEQEAILRDLIEGGVSPEVKEALARIPVV